MSERYQSEKQLWMSYASFHQKHPKSDCEAKVDFYHQNSKCISLNSQNLNPKTAIVIPAYNESEYIPRTLASINSALMSYEEKDVSVIVVDNNSTDETGQIAKEFGALVIREPKKGIGQARQTGLEATPESVEFVLTTDADTVITRNWIKVHQESLKNTGVVFTYGKTRFISDQQLSVINSTLLIGYTTAANLFHIINNKHGSLVCGSANVGYQRDIALLCGGYNRKFNSAEDVDIMRRMSEYGQLTRVNNTVLTSARRMTQKGILQHGFETFKKNLKRFMGEEPDNPESEHIDYR